MGWTMCRLLYIYQTYAALSTSKVWLLAKSIEIGQLWLVRYVGIFVIVCINNGNPTFNIFPVLKFLLFVHRFNYLLPFNFDTSKRNKAQVYVHVNLPIYSLSLSSDLVESSNYIFD